jgi:hypothetical protein
MKDLYKIEINWSGETYCIHRYASSAEHALSLAAAFIAKEKGLLKRAVWIRLTRGDYAYTITRI